eukprot:GILK01007235.1.p1 GENE.GILK01007235.1~~GILK01007235.1.p1  ORF type:complete len:1115 (-),score=201.45 GILK01007235.1:181-3039(-)
MPATSVPVDVSSPYVAVDVTDDFTLRLVQEDTARKSWRTKLEFVTDFLSQEDVPITLHHLTSIATYLNFINAGEIVCQEDGRHMRPNHHALMAKKIDLVLSRLTNPQTSFLTRRIYPLLPSYRGSFTVSVPLTRIRDIAHRNDIPQDLKNEIKHKLQNKLHRCAGPEDLRTCEDILSRITAPGAHFSGDFVNQFTIFHQELREFFNASSLDDRLNDVRSMADVDQDIKGLIQSFLEHKNNHSTRLETRINSLTALRERCVSFIKTRTADGSTDEVVQQVRLAEIALEDVSFVMFSEWINSLTDSAQAGWDEPLRALLFLLRNLELSQLQPEECAVIQADVTQFQQKLSMTDTTSNGHIGNGLSNGHAAAMSRDDLLRLKAALDRSVRISNNFSETVFSTFQSQVEQLGQALGIPRPVYQIFSEGTIRSHLTFQLAKVVSLLLKRVRSAASLPPWECIVPGRVRGKLRRARRMADITSKVESEGDYVIIVDFADGDEEIPTGVSGIILGHDLPHLSHLAVRARQSGAVFAASDHRETFEALKREFEEYNGQTVELQVSVDRVALSKIKCFKSPNRGRGSPSPVVLTRLNGTIPPQMSLNGDGEGSGRAVPAPVDLNVTRMLPIAEASRSSSGAKASAALLLEKLCHIQGSTFKTPRSAVLPYGCMRTVLNGTAGIEEYNAKIDNLVAIQGVEGCEPVAQFLREWVQRKVTIPSDVIQSIQKAFKGASRIMVRSSANVEDLEKISGAGLYDSVADVDVTSPEAVSKAILTVWSSLWSKRATISRQQARMDHHNAHMAVLLQEMIPAQQSFILHTLNPLNGRADEVYMEVAVGMGETLASAEQRGTPYRLVYNSTNHTATTLSFANYSFSLHPADEHRRKENGQETVGFLYSKVVDYSQQVLTTNDTSRHNLAIRLGEIGKDIDNYFGCPQDIEGVLLDDEVYIVQSRPQPLANQ